MRKVEFGEIATFSQGQQVSIPDQKTEKFDGCDTFLRIVNYTQNSDDFRYIPKQSHKHHVSTNDIIMVRYGAVGFVGRGLSGVLANNMFKINFDKDQVDGNYLFRTLWSDFVQKQLLNASQSTSMAAINFKTTSKITIPLPPLDQQKKIASILDAAYAYKQKTKALIEKYDQLTQSLFLDMFGDPVTNPKGWEIKMLSEVSSITTKGSSPKWQGYDYISEGVRFVTSENVRLGYLDISKDKFIAKEFHDKLKRSQLKLNDLLVNLVGASIGRGALVSRESLPANINQAVARTELDHSKVNPLFILQQIITPQVQDRLIGNKVEGARANISLKNVRELKLYIPPLDFQNQFAERVQAIEAQKAQAQASLAQAEDLFNSLLQRAFKGELTS